MKRDSRLERIINNCWNQIGVWGDKSCPELKRVTHCRNCEVYASAGLDLLDREAPQGYQREWTSSLQARPREIDDSETIPAVIFRLGKEWLALPTRLFKEVTEARSIHSLPHRSNDVLLGLVNIRGEMRLCVSIGNFLGIEKEAEADQKTNSREQRRMMVVEQEGETWVCPVDEIYGTHRFHSSELLNVPATVAKSSASYTKGLLSCGGKNVGYLDFDLLFYALKRRVL